MLESRPARSRWAQPGAPRRRQAGGIEAPLQRSGKAQEGLTGFFGGIGGTGGVGMPMLMLMMIGGKVLNAESPMVPTWAGTLWAAT